ncbi:MAG: ABC transporter substrate-binding protein [Bacteroidales bacterium]
MKKLSVALIVCICTFISSIMQAQQQPLIFTPQWTPQSQFAGYYVALEKGFYKEAGINVIIQHPSSSNSAINKLTQGKSQAITLQLIQAMRYVAEGMPLVNILQTSQNNSLMLVAHKHITCLDSLCGKKVGRWKVGFDELAHVLDKEKNLNIEWIPFLQNVNIFISKAIDATLVMSYNEYFQLLSSGVKLSSNCVFRFSEIGYNIPEDGIYVTSSYYKTHKEQLHRFAEASRRGWEWAATHQKETLDIVMRLVKEYKVSTNRTVQQWMLKEILELQRKKPDGKATFTLNTKDFNKANDVLMRGGFITKEINYDSFIGL